MIKVARSDEDMEDRWLALFRQKYTVREIVLRYRRFRATYSRVKRGIDRARLRESPSGTARPSLRPPKLVLIFDAGCKAKPTCRDIHPCRWCKGWGLYHGRHCLPCKGTGVGKIPRGTACCCADCHKSGKDGHPALNPYPLPPREKQVESGGLNGGIGTTKSKRKKSK